MKVSWNKRFVPNNFFSMNSNTYTMHNPFIKHIPILNFINLDLKLKDIIAIKVTLLNLQSKHKIGNDFGNNFAVLSAFNGTLSFLSFKYINTLKTQQEFVKVLNAFIFKGMHHWNNENPAGWITELLTDLSSNSNLYSLYIREILLTRLCNDEISKNFILLRNNDENPNLVEGENILKLKIAPNESVAESNWINYDFLVNWSEEKENYHYQHEILNKYIIYLESSSWKLENNKNLTEGNK